MRLKRESIKQDSKSMLIDLVYGDKTALIWYVGKDQY